VSDKQEFFFSCENGIATKHKIGDDLYKTACGIEPQGHAEDKPNLHSEHDLPFENECEICFPSNNIVAAVEAETAKAADEAVAEAAANSKASAKRESDTSRAMAELVGALEKAIGRSRGRNGDSATLRAICILFDANPTLLWGAQETLKKSCELADACRLRLMQILRPHGGGPDAFNKLTGEPYIVARDLADVLSAFQLLLSKADAIAQQVEAANKPKVSIVKPGGLILPTSFRRG
jgi:hypothetical protein